MFPLSVFNSSCVLILILFLWEISHSKIVKALMFQEKIIDELGNEMDGTSNRLDFVQVSFCF